MATLQERIDAALLLVGSDMGALAAQINGTLTDGQLRATPLSVNAVSSNITGKFRDAFESYTPGVKWNEAKASGDLVYVDGNAAAASYLVISKSPLNAGNETLVETISTFGMPVELSFGAHLSQRTLGQEFSFELVDTEPPLADVPELAISSISQTTTTLTINFATPHGLSIGKSIGVSGVTDSRANYPSLVVATIPTPLQITCTGGPMNTLPSLTIAQVNGSGVVFFRERLGRANNGVSQIFENVTATNASGYVRSESGDAFPSGVIFSNHSIACGTTASNQLLNAANTYAFAATTEFRIVTQADRVQWYDSNADSTGQTANRLKRTQVCPDPSKTYRFRIRTKNNKSLTVPIAQIVSVTKSASTTATIVFDRPHGLTTTDQIVAYGVRDQTNFVNLTAATAIASIVNTTTITCIWGASVTATSYGGYVARVNGGNLMSALGAIAQVASTATLTDGILTIVGNAAWAGALIGDTLELVGIRNSVNGTSLDIDGPWRIKNIATTTLTLEPLGFTAPANFTVTNCGGGVIKRTDLRVSFVRIFDYERERIEFLAMPSGDSSGAVPVVLQSTAGISGTVTINAIPAGANLIGSTALAAPQLVADIASAAITTSTSSATFIPTYGDAYEVNIPVTAISGTSPTLDVSIEESDDSGTNWYKVYDFPRITITGIYRSPKIPLKGNRVRYIQTITGTTPSFTRAINRLQISDNIDEVRQLFDRTINLNLLNSTTPTPFLNVQNCKNAQMVLSQGAGATSAPQVQLEGSDDNGASWYSIGAPLVGVVSASVQLTVNNVNAQLVRGRVSTAGVAVTMGYLLIKGF